jgi:hypothetical protein
MQHVQKAAAWMRANGWSAANVGLMVLGLMVLAILEAQAAKYALASAAQKDMWMTPWGAAPSAAILSAGKSVGFSLMAFFGMFVAGHLAQHERASSRSQAWVARLVALGCMTVPVGNLASYLALERESKEWEVYVSSPAYEADKALAQDYDADSRTRAEVAQKLTPPSVGNRDLPDWLAAIFWHALVMWAASVRFAPPMSEAERAAAALAEKRERERQRRKDRKRRQQKRQPAGPILAFARG